MAKIRSCRCIEVYLSKSYFSISITINKFNSWLSHVLSYPFLRCHRTWEPFDYSSLKTVDRQKLVYEMYHEEINHHEKHSPSINHKCTVQTDGVVKISVYKVIRVSDFLMQKCCVNLYKHNNKNGVDVLFRALVTLFPESWTPKLYAIFLCDLVLRQSMWMRIYLDIKYDNSIGSINGISVLYPVNISKLKYDANSSLALSFIKG